MLVMKMDASAIKKVLYHLVQKLLVVLKAVKYATQMISLCVKIAYLGICCRVGYVGDAEMVVKNVPQHLQLVVPDVLTIGS